jgi:hypothetical protein
VHNLAGYLRLHRRSEPRHRRHRFVTCRRYGYRCHVSAASGNSLSSAWASRHRG